MELVMGLGLIVRIHFASRRLFVGTAFLAIASLAVLLTSKEGVYAFGGIYLMVNVFVLWAYDMTQQYRQNGYWNTGSDLISVAEGICAFVIYLIIQALG